MTDDLVTRLRGRSIFCRGRGEIKSPELMEEAVDRIEQLEHERDRLIEPEQVEGLVKMAEPIMTELYAVECAYRQEAEAKLAKAVEALRELVTCVEDGCFCSEMKMAAAISDARAALAEIEKDNK